MVEIPEWMRARLLGGGGSLSRGWEACLMAYDGKGGV